MPQRLREWWKSIGCAFQVLWIVALMVMVASLFVAMRPAMELNDFPNGFVGWLLLNIYIALRAVGDYIMIIMILLTLGVLASVNTSTDKND